MFIAAEEIERRLRRALANREEVRFALLFGSTVTRERTAADVDVAASFAHPMSLWDVARLSDVLEDEIGRPVDLVDLDDASTLLRWEAAKNGRTVAERDRDALVAFLARMPLEFDDLRPFLEREGVGVDRVLDEVRWSPKF